ncbi:MAG: hypothetical protein LBK68_03560 [Candidatus Margulisbacteria bacterium]|jgi:hypothetical protein|nr:hypothetical protein [Candidatus Margulisiibacteriota bacterium]
MTTRKQARAAAEKNLADAEPKFEIYCAAGEAADNIPEEEIEEVLAYIATDVELVRLKKDKREELPSYRKRAMDIEEKPSKDLLALYKEIDTMIWNAIDKKVIEMWEAKHILITEVIGLLRDFVFEDAQHRKTSRRKK